MSSSVLPVSSSVEKVWTNSCSETKPSSGALVTRDDAPMAVVSISISDAGIDQILWVMNPRQACSALDRISPVNDCQVPRNLFL